MTPVIPCSLGSVHLLTKTTLHPRKELQQAKSSVYRRYSCSKPTCILTQTLSQSLLQRCGDRKHILRLAYVRAVGTDVATEEHNPSASEELSGDLPGEPAADGASAPLSSTTTTIRSKRSRPTRRTDMPPVKDEELVPGAAFTGKVRSIQPFGAFIDFGAFTDGLVHVSKLSDDFVKDVSSVVSVGQEVKVKIVEVNMESRRISLTMREGEDTSKPQQRKEASDGDYSEKPRTGRKNAPRSNRKRDDPQKSTKFVKGQVLDGVVKNLARAGSFITLPEGEEGFLPISEESEGFGNILGNSSLSVGQEVKVRVLRIARGQLTLTMKKEENVNAINMKLNQGVVHTATNPFVVAFRKNKDIASFLEEREQTLTVSETMPSEELKEVSVNEITESTQIDASQSDSLTTSDPSSLELSEASASSDSETLVSEGKPEVAISDSVQPDVLPEIPEVPSASPVVSEASVTSETEKNDPSLEVPEIITSSNSSEAAVSEENPETVGSSLAQPEAPKEISEVTIPSASLVDPEASLTTEIEKANASNDSADEESIAVTEPASSADASNENNDSSTETSTSSDAVNISESVGEKDDEVAKIDDNVAASIAESSEANVRIGVQEEELSLDSKIEEVFVTSQHDDLVILKETVEYLTEPVVAQASSTDDTSDTNLESAQSVSTSSIEESSISENNSTKASISPALVKQLREETGAGMMDCKKALAETNGDVAKAQEYLRKKGLAGADKKAGRATAEGRVGSYIHDSRIGILVEVNCETDFVSGGEIFRELVDDLAMQVAACPQVQYLTIEDVPEDIVNKEREIEMQKEDLLSKPEQMRSKIVDGRIRKRLQEFALLEQPYIKNDKMTVSELVKQTIATLGENIKVKRFVRYNLGEGLEKKSQDFAAEVAAQTAAKSPPPVSNEPPAETKETSDKAPTVAISAALVKQLREETGAGMMDCKKALAATGGDLQEAQEYLRKKGLSSADKKSSRIAAEGTIASYIHDSRIGVLMEVNCETDFVAQNEKFKELVSDLAMQVVACPQVQFVSMEDLPEDVASKEKEIEMQREDLQSKPENIREKIVEGRVSKRLGELVLLEQPFIKDDGVLVKDLVKQTVAAIGENIRVRRFVRFTLGE